MSHLFGVDQRAPDCDERNKVTMKHFNRWIDKFLTCSTRYGKLGNMKDGDTCLFSGFYVTRHIPHDTDGGWSIKEEEDSDIFLYISNDGTFAEYMFPITATYNPDLPPLKMKTSCPSESSPEKKTTAPQNYTFKWSKGVYRH